MKLSDCIKMAFSDLNKRKFRTVLTSFGIAIGTLLVILMGGFGEGVQKISMDQIKQMDSMRLITVRPYEYVNQKASGKSAPSAKDKKIDNNILNKFKNIKGVSSVNAGIGTQVSTVKLENKTLQKVDFEGYNLDYDVFNKASENQVRMDKEKSKKFGYKPIIAGENLKKTDENSVLVGKGLLKRLGLTNEKSVVGKEIEIKVEFPKIEGMPEKAPLVIKAKVAGVVNKLYENGGIVITGNDSMAAKIQEYYMNSKDYINEKGYDKVTVEAKDMDSVSSVSHRIQKLNYSYIAQGDYANQINNVYLIFKILLIAAGAIVLLVASIGVINTMTMAVHEKTKMIGIMKAQGASRRNIKRMFIVQSGSLGFLGAMGGTIVALISSVIINKVLVAYKVGGIEAGMKMVDIRASIIIFTILFTIIVSMLAGLLPAGKAAKLNPVDSLRFE
ncbi:putative ABC transport system permease protein [Clostridium acetobutylicum]|uniref:Predicted permease n=1 Tax=Clostridium acetobutylicum (strain ATCC 824 / DSM 792 / JCM 1419 / IAM 19013 / LMG 5710 / NBRC 13948 / NRRL B-527 / VKM B-1787 / 2291 / W) TaxID=272562 RepID=Q97D97_CLOAB|nr:MULTISPECIES: ABC transporter permease [Clostridium]AAK81506.1 Predicted permease [Clostridium acetobutylicum ATCC 824]ADZ22627.1 permease [Clostridium acetobutylicum EA 2018]AEI34534.1 permease [Clostridium acetobutylicum DSM 1731]AWV80820.1 ABC transporter permease [Clostridium acetobutylicum]MBC2393854.1 ABC transporter permease [Clostridium acetobutylicum]